MKARSEHGSRDEGVVGRSPAPGTLIVACLLVVWSLSGCGVGAEVRYPIDVERPVAEPEEQPYDDSGFGEAPEAPADEVEVQEEEPATEEGGTTVAEEQVELPASAVGEQE